VPQSAQFGGHGCDCVAHLLVALAVRLLEGRQLRCILGRADIRGGLLLLDIVREVLEALLQCLLSELKRPDRLLLLLD
jgi:hypothetical protein